MSGPQRALSPDHPLPRLPSSPIIPSTINTATIPGGDGAFLSPPGAFNPRLLPNPRTLPPLSALSLPAHWPVPPSSPPTRALLPLPPRDPFPLECYFRRPPSAAIEQARRIPPLVPSARALPADATWSTLSVFPPPEELPELEFHLPLHERRTQTFTEEQIEEWRQGDSRQSLAAQRVEPDASLRLAPLEYRLPAEQRPHSPDGLEAPRRRDTQQTAVAGPSEAASAAADIWWKELLPQPVEPPVVMDESVRYGLEKLRRGRPAKKGRVARVRRARHRRPHREDYMGDVEMSGALQ
ncbi:hypothetical protein W97_06180 [Coniosporium apollinis CBS 100218]|uniref:Uncharacterized protein n=1 Tax=Coniosporium apollinis (strain CBS 100218) TaxID=1168221 RepID=R7YYY7_CONA1|nr:uncharacterized protein W97_06180 [Coniosporium apollinis CBS 100218]EON67063.1 hypothetical protein W97_06180 [Coniosporium apollinis CBS 100218]